MFFFLSKTVDTLATPLVWALALGAAGLWGASRKVARLTLAAPASGLAILYLFSTEPVANALLRGLESSARATARWTAPYDAVIVLGGVVDQKPAVPNYTDAADRLLAGFDLLRTGRARYALLAGGRAAEDNPLPESVVLERQLESWGIAADRIAVDDRSRNTHENAIEVARIVRLKGWTRLLLVTSAFHLKRAAGCVRRAGLDFDTWPVDFRSYDPTRFTGSWLPRADSLAESSTALREYLGRAVYSWLGYSVSWP